MNLCTIFENITIVDKPHFISIDKALERIKTGKSRVRVEQIRTAIDKEKAQDLKKLLPSVCFSGEFEKRYDNNILTHSGYMVLDFDEVQDISEKMAKLCSEVFVYSAWVSPSGNGIKALVRVADGKQHRAHFAALKDIFPDADNSGINESRVCYESYDPNIYINIKAIPFVKIKTYEKIESKEVVADEREIFDKLLKWISNKGGSFSKGERNIFIFKLASSCCRFGIHPDNALYLITSTYPTSNDFTDKEAGQTIKSAYRANNSKFGTAQFEKDILVDKTTRKEVQLPKDSEIVIDENDIIYGASVKENALNIFNNGYENVLGVGIPKLDYHFKAKRGELTCLTGIGNYGKSAFLKWYFLLRILLYGEKFASYCPEDNPPEEYYHDFVEILLGCNCTPNTFEGQANTDKPKLVNYDNAYDFISNHIFYLYPKNNKPSPTYVLESFLALVIKEKISGICIDPWNQLSHDYNSIGRTDQYLENELARIQRFAQINNVYSFIVVHPKSLTMQATGNYPCPDAYDLNGGAMWNNKLDNLLVYHRPHGQTEPNSPIAEFHAKKIKRQKTVGKKGFIQIEYNLRTRRFEIDGYDPINDILRKMDLSFNRPVVDFKPTSPAHKVEKRDNAFTGFNNQNRYNPEDWKD